MSVFHLRRDPESQRWRWRLVDDADGQEKVLATSAQTWPTKAECSSGVEQMRLAVAQATTMVDTTLPRVGGRWRAIDPVTGQTGGPSRAEDGEYDEGETGPPVAEITPEPPRDREPPDAA